jgi:hypothetical protein
MGIFDKAKDVLGQHSDKVDQGVDKLADLADRRTGDQHSEHIDQGAQLAKDKLGEVLRGDNPPA